MSVATMKEAEAMDMKEQAENFRWQVLKRGGVGARVRATWHVAGWAANRCRSPAASTRCTRGTARWRGRAGIPLVTGDQ